MYIQVAVDGILYVWVVLEIIIDDFYKILVSENLIKQEMLDNFFLHKQDNNRILATLLEHEVLDFDRLAIILETNFSIKSVVLSTEMFNGSILALISHNMALKYNCIPVKVDGEKLFLASSEPFNSLINEDIQILTGHAVIVLFAHPKEINYFINKFYGSEQINSIASEFIPNIDDKINNAFTSLNQNKKGSIQNAPTVKFVHSLIESAVIRSASDIHIEPFETHIRTRYRIDGCLVEFENIDCSLLQSIISLLKIMGNMDISEKRFPQDGHFRIGDKYRNIDFRISTMPVKYGEKAVIRLIYKENIASDKSNLGFFPEDLNKISDLLRLRGGAILLTGPTGSGKTTTLASFINELNKPDINIVTIEDPIENEIYGVNQIEINPKTGLTFANALRHILRQDPNVIMVGEIRDNETAKIAIGAAITGHLVLSTLHTNDALSAIIRLIDMGIEVFKAVASINGIISQRLVRKLCPLCKKQVSIGDKYDHSLKLEKNTLIFEAVGCSSCNQTGYLGRFAVYEILTVDYKLKKLLENRTPYEQIKIHLTNNKMQTMWDCAVRNLLLGNTSLEEIYRSVYQI